MPSLKKLSNELNLNNVDEIIAAGFSGSGSKSKSSKSGSGSSSMGSSAVCAGSFCPPPSVSGSSMSSGSSK